jgi:hypothetical protein
MTSGAVAKSIRFLGSTELAVGLFLVVCLAAIPGTFLENREVIYKSPLFVALLALLGVNLALCTVRRVRSIPKPVLVLHAGVLLTLAGCILTAFGFVATINMYEGTSTDQAFRWDLQQDVPIGVELTVRGVHREYYPVPVKVGVLRGSEKLSLHTLRTGESFMVDGYSVRAEELLLPLEVLRLTVWRDGEKIGSCDTEGAGDLPAWFPYQFRLNKYMNPVLRRMWVDVLLSDREGKAEGVAEVNHPFTWRGLHFYNTQIARDDQGRTYAGIQIVKDPGRPLVFAGFAVTCVGALLCFARRFSKKSIWN